VRDIPELAAAVKKGSHICMTFNETSVIQHLMESENDELKTIGKSLEAHQTTMGLDEVFKSTNKKVAYIGSRLFLAIHERQYFLSKDFFLLTWHSVAVRKGFCCKRALDRVIIRIWETGLYQKINRDKLFFNTLRNSQTKSDPEHSLTLGDTVGAFTIYIIGLTLATVTFLLEIVFGQLLKTCKVKSR
jgi:hypothetical protein